MPFNHATTIARFLANPGSFPDIKYGVKLEPAAVAAGQFYWRCIGVYHLAGAENDGRNNIFLEALDEQGRRIGPPWPRVGWSWEGQQPHQRPNPVTLDKPPNEPGGNIALHAAQVVTVWMIGRPGQEGPSDKVLGLQTGHDDEGPGNTRYHHSFYVVWQWTKATGQPVPPVEPPDPEEPPTPVEGFTRFIELYEDDKLEVKLMVTVKGD